MLSRQVGRLGQCLGKKSLYQHPAILKSSYSTAGGFNFELTDEQKSLKDLARKFSREEIAPKAAHYDQTGEFPWDLHNKAHELGLLSVSIPERKYS